MNLSEPYLPPELDDLFQRVFRLRGSGAGGELFIARKEILDSLLGTEFRDLIISLYDFGEPVVQDEQIYETLRFFASIPRDREPPPSSGTLPEGDYFYAVESFTRATCMLHDTGLTSLYQSLLDSFRGMYLSAGSPGDFVSFMDSFNVLVFDAEVPDRIVRGFYLSSLFRLLSREDPVRVFDFFYDYLPVIHSLATMCREDFNHLQFRRELYHEYAQYPRSAP